MEVAVLISGGLGTRLRPVTYETPKPLIPVQGRTLTEHILDVLKEGGVRKIYMSIGYMADRIMSYFGDGKKFGVDMHYLIEDRELGTGGWMKLIDPKPFGHFVVLNGDNLLEVDFEEMHQVHLRNQALVTLALTEVADVSSRGVVKLEGDKIVEFVEKPKPQEAPSNLISTGYYIFSSAVFDILPEGKSFMLEHHVFPKVAGMGRLCGYPCGGQWFDTGTFERWQEAIFQWRKI